MCDLFGVSGRGASLNMIGSMNYGAHCLCIVGGSSAAISVAAKADVTSDPYLCPTN